MPEIISGLWFILLAMLQLSMSDRRIKGGREITSNQKYAVYLLRTPDAPVRTRGWTCGGTIVSRSFVVTAASCVKDLQRVYVIAGYKKFVTSSQIDIDECTSKTKRKVVLVCEPKEYELNYTTTEAWARVDIAVLKVDRPFDVSAKMYAKYCSYIPTSININYWRKYQDPGVDALTMGWGHLVQHKKDLDVHNYNVDTIRYTPTKILEKKKCLSYFPDNKKMHPIIEKYMICTLDPGSLNDEGRVISKVPLTPGCISKKDKLMGKIGRTCDREKLEIIHARKDLISQSNAIIGARKDLSNATINARKDVSNGTIDAGKDVSNATIYAGKDLINATMDTKKNLNNVTLESRKDLSNLTLDARKDLVNAKKDPGNNLSNTSIVAENGLSNLNNITIRFGKDLSNATMDPRKDLNNTTSDAKKDITNLSNATIDAKINLNNSRKYEDNNDNQTQSFLPVNGTTTKWPPLPEDIKMDNESLRIASDRKAREAPGICQNDHGGPLVTWVGNHMVLIGVATLYKVDDALNCMGPYLFTSIYCTGAFLDCILSLENGTDSGRRCENSEKQPFKIIRRHIAWNDKDDDGDVQEVKEIVRIRPQIPISAFHL